MAEGVESAEQAAVFKKLGCEKAEEPLYGKPIEVKNFAKKYIF
ncbi:hypothetical protein [Robinsoniella sp.]